MSIVSLLRLAHGAGRDGLSFDEFMREFEKAKEAGKGGPGANRNPPVPEGEKDDVVSSS